MESAWNQVKESMKNQLSDNSFRMWIQPIRFISHEVCSTLNQETKNSDSQEPIMLTLLCPNSFSKKRVKESYLVCISEEFQKLGYSNVKIELDIEDKDKTELLKKDSKLQLTNKSDANSRKKVSSVKTPKENLKLSSRDQQLNLPGLPDMFATGRMLKRDYTFDHFVVGNNNSFAYSASLSMAQNSSNSNGAIYLLGGTGLGKSHLSQAIGHHVISQGATKRVFYITAEDFTNEMIHSIQNNSIRSFKEKYRKKCDVLILEDVHFLSGKEATQKELAVTLDYLMDSEKKIIFSDCYLPNDIPKMNEQLKSRLTVGLVTKIEPPDFSTRVKILKKKSELNGYNIPNDVIDYISQELCDNVRQLESGLAGVVAKASLMEKKIDISLANEVIENIARIKKQISIESIKKLICREFGISEEELISASRQSKLVHPRQVAIYLSRKYTDQPLKTISKSFNRYHATVIYSINAVEKAIMKQGVMSEQLNYLYKKIEDGKI